MDIREMTAEEINQMPRLRYRKYMDNELAYQWLFRCFVRQSDFPKTYQIIDEVLDHKHNTLYHTNPFEVAKELFWADTHRFCPKDIFMEKAFRDQLYQNADSLAADYLGDLHYLPRYQQLNDQKALRYYTVAAKEGRENAMARLGIIYYRQNRLKKAYPFLLKAALLGDAEAKFQLAELYWQGEGVKQDLCQAQKLYQEVVKKKEQSEDYVRALIRMSQFQRMVAEPEESFLSNLNLLHAAEYRYFKLYQELAGTDAKIEEALNHERMVVKQAIKQRKFICGSQGIYVQTTHAKLTVNNWTEADIEDLQRLAKSDYFQKAAPFSCPNDQWASLDLIQTTLIGENIFAIRMRDRKNKYPTTNQPTSKQPFVERSLPFDENQWTHHIKNRANQGITTYAIGYAQLEKVGVEKRNEYRLQFCFENEAFAQQYTEEIFEKLITYAFDRLESRRIWLVVNKSDRIKQEYIQQNGFKPVLGKKAPFKADGKDMEYFQLTEKSWMSE